MSETKPMPPTTDEKVRLFLSSRKDAGKHIDPATAEVFWSYEQTMDPYGIDPDLPEELQQVGREYFARSPGSDIWVCFRDLPEATRTALWEKHKHELASPAGLEPMLDADCMATILRDARPIRAARVVLIGENKAKVDECEAPDLESLDVVDQGFDPHGPCGPTYWRVTASHYYSTMLTEKGIMLSITKLDR
jgi:hypothetical protein